MEHAAGLYEEIVERAKADGAVDQESWDGLVEEVVEEYRTQGLIHDDEPTEKIEEDLRHRFAEYEESVRQEGL